MKSKIILVVILVVSLLLGMTLVVKATDELQARTNINLEDTVGEDVNYDDQIDPISLDSEDIGGNNLQTGESFERGDVYIFQENANVEGYVDGNLYVMANNVNISSYVDGNVFVMGKMVTINGNITGSLFACGENINFYSGYAKDAYFYAEKVVVNQEATIEREAKMAGEGINIVGQINGDAYAVAEQTIVAPTANITGKLVYSGELSKAREDQIGSIEKQEIKLPETRNNFINKAEDVLFNTITALVIVGLMVLASNKKMEEKITVGDCFKGVLAGLGWMVLIPIIIVLLMITVVGIPVSLILLIAYILMYFIAIPAVALQISTYILNIKNKDSKVLRWLLAVVIYCALAILRLVPVLSFLLSLLLGTYGFNLIIKTVFSKKKQDKVETVVE